MKKYFTVNDLTTFFGTLAGLPLLVATSMTSMNITMTPLEIKILGFTGAIGLIGLGLVSKSVGTHSTVAQVEASSAVVQGQIDAPAKVIAADAEVAGKK
jgi:hypothetical protein